MTNNIPTIYIGYDSKEEVAYKVLQESILDHTSAPVNIIPLQQGRLRNNLILERISGSLFSTLISFPL